MLFRSTLSNIDLDGFIFEIQVHLEALYQLKEESHEILDIARAAIEPTMYKLDLLYKNQEKSELVAKLREQETEITNLKMKCKEKNEIICRMHKSEVNFLKTQLEKERANIKCVDRPRLKTSPKLKDTYMIEAEKRNPFAGIFNQIQKT